MSKFRQVSHKLLRANRNLQQSDRDMNRKSFCLTLLFTIIFFSLIWKVSAGIGGAEPEYNYREFLIEDFHYDFSVAADSHDPVRD